MSSNTSRLFNDGDLVLAKAYNLPNDFEVTTIEVIGKVVFAGYIHPLSVDDKKCGWRYELKLHDSTTCYAWEKHLEILFTI
jgi:hypothetical protein